MKKRFIGSGEGIYSFMDETLVVCPQCSGCAVSRQVDKEAPHGWFSPRRLTCNRCSFVKDWCEREIARGWRRQHDDYFDLPLWLQTPCCGEALWAYNERHITWLEEYVGAGLRENARHDEYGWSNGSLASRLPRWMKSAKHREEVLKGLARLRKRLLDLT